MLCLILRKLFKSGDKTKGEYNRDERVRLSRKYGALCKSLSSQGFIVIIATISMYSEIYSWNRKNLPNYFEVYLNVPIDELQRRDPKKIYRNFSSGNLINVAGLDLEVDLPTEAHLIIDYKSGQTTDIVVDVIVKSLKMEKLI